MSLADEAGRENAAPLAPLDDRRSGVIFAAALDTFSEKGVAATRLSDIAARAGIGVETLQARFADRDSLLIGVVAWAGRLTGIDPAIIAFPHEAITTRLERLALAMEAQAFAPQTVAVVRLMLAEGWRYPALVAAYEDAFRQPVAALAGALSVRLIEKGHMAPEDEEDFLAALEGWIQAEAIKGMLGLAPPSDEKAARKRARTIAKRLVRGFAVPVKPGRRTSPAGAQQQQQQRREEPSEADETEPAL
jgi:AcrR family transcriptional regulator